MLFDSCPDLLVDDSPAARRTGRALVAIAAIGLAGSLLISSPPRFSAQHQADGSPLHWVVEVLGLFGWYPTAKGTEIRNTMFYLAAAALALVAAIRLLTCGRRPRLAFDDLLDVRERAVGPITWWLFFVFCCILTSAFSHAQRLALGQAAIHLFFVAWWLPLASLLSPTEARRLAGALTGILWAVGAVGLWYFWQRVYPNAGLQARLKYPLGNELWMAACLLPAPFIAFGLWGKSPITPFKSQISNLKPAALILAIFVTTQALALTRSRSATLGAAVGILTLVIFLAKRDIRRGLLVLTLALAATAGAWLFRQRNNPDSVIRSHSLRARLDYEWPYALRLVRAKPILGYGDGTYGLLAGSFARADQLDDPSVMSFDDETSWVEHPDSEPLQLLAETGIVGTLALVAALTATLLAALRYCDAARDEPARRADRRLVAALAAALAAIVAEECSANGLRQPGLPPVLLTVWALLWALVRRHRPASQVAPEDKWLKPAALSAGGAIAGAMGLALVAIALLDARATRKRFDADAALAAGRCDEAIALADEASPAMLNAFQQLCARLIAAQARSIDFDRRLQATSRPADADLAVAGDGLSRLASIDADAPHFLRVAGLRAELLTNLVRACVRRDEPASVLDFARKRDMALRDRLHDEPFRVANVQALWVAFPNAPAPDRLTWLRGLARAGQISPPVVELFMSLARAPDFVPSLNDLYGVASADQSRSPDQWQDRLSPETLRLAAIAKDFQGRPDEAAQIAAHAAEMYRKAGARLFAPHAACLHELTRYRFFFDPTADFDKRLQELAAAATRLGSPVAPTDPLPDPMGSTRLSILVAAGREDEARAQIRRIAADADENQALARTYATLAAAFAEMPARRTLCLTWAHRAAALAPTSPDAQAILARLLLQSGDPKSARIALESVKRLASADAYAQLIDQLRTKFPDARQLLNEPALRPTTAPAQR